MKHWAIAVINETAEIKFKIPNKSTYLVFLKLKERTKRYFWLKLNKSKANTGNWDLQQGQIMDVCRSNCLRQTQTKLDKG